jgi:hypothetical protein
MPSSTGPLRFTQTFRAAAIGHRAVEVVREPVMGRVIGSISRGIFILAPPQQIIFLSYEDYAGPLTINLNLPQAQTLPASQDQEVDLQHDEIILPELRTHILLDQSRIWSPPAPPESILTLNLVDQALRSLVNKVIEKKRGVGLAPLLPFILDLPARPTVPISLQPTIANVLLLKQNFLVQPLSASLPQIKDLMGLGRGLTPSGDDFINGLLLVLNRVPQRANFQPQLTEFNHQIVELAFSKTTSLSANLIEAAALGSADERLLFAVDGLLTGLHQTNEILAALDAYGSSSGIDALAGAALMIQALIGNEKHPA